MTTAARVLGTPTTGLPKIDASASALGRVALLAYLPIASGVIAAYVAFPDSQLGELMFVVSSALAVAALVAGPFLHRPTGTLPWRWLALRQRACWLPTTGLLTGQPIIRPMFKSTDAQTPDEYIERLDEPRRTEIRRLHELIQRTAPTLEPHLASGMLAYGRYKYRPKRGPGGEWFHIGLASNKRYISLYIMATDPAGGRYLAETYKDRLPTADIGKSCVRFKSADDLDQAALTQLIREGASFGPIGQV